MSHLFSFPPSQGHACDILPDFLRKIYNGMYWEPGNVGLYTIMHPEVMLYKIQTMILSTKNLQHLGIKQHDIMYKVP